MSWQARSSKKYQPKKFRPRQRTSDEIEYQRKIELAKEEAKKHALKLEAERKEKQIQEEKQENLRRELQEIERKQFEIKQKEDAANKYFKQKEKIWKHRLLQRELNLIKINNKSDKNKKDNKNLETKIKKIEGFLRKTKQFDKHCKNINGLIKEMKKLKLGPYLDEIVKDLTNASISDKDEIDKLLYLASSIHQRFDTKFTKPFRDGILDAFRPKLDLNDIQIRKKQLLNLVILIEMQYLGLLNNKKRQHQQQQNDHSTSTLYELLKHIIKIEIKHKDKLFDKINKLKLNNKTIEIKMDDNFYKMEDKQNKNEITAMIYEYDDIMIHTLSLITKFLKYANEECLGSISISLKKHYDILGKPFKPKYHQILTSKQRKQLNDLITTYFNKICNKYKELDLKLRKQIKTNNIILIERGSISDSRQEITDKLENVVNGLKENINAFCEHLDYAQFPIPLEMNDEIVTLNIDGQITSLQDAQNASFFDDEVSRSFYENLPHLKDNIPGSLLQGDIIKNYHQINQNDNDDDIDIDIDNVNITEMPKYLINNDDIDIDIDIDDNDDDDDDSDNNNKQKHESKEINTMKKLLNTLQCMGSRKETEFLAEKFCYLNSKNNRKYLASFLSQIRSNENTRLPFYARFIAILNLSDINIGDRICLSIEKEFYRLFFSSNKKWLQDAKMSNLSYIAELTKFSIFPFDAIFNILEKLSKKFNNESIELLSFFMYQCGRYLYKNPITHCRLNKILKYLKRRQMQTNLDTFLNQHILNAIYACKPPEKSALSMINKLTPIQQYVEHLLYFKLNHENKQTILRKLRKLPWNDLKIQEFVIDKLFNISIVNFEKIDCIAAIIQGLNCYHSISSKIVDNVCEEIRIGLEEEDFTQEQRRLSYVKFLGELYTYKAVNSQVIMDTLYLIITYNINQINNNNIIIFRISLCCMLLEVCGKYLRKGKLKQRCDRFLLYFQRFIILINKQTYIPFDIEWWVNDVFIFVAPNMKRYYDLQQILEKIKDLDMTHKDALFMMEEDEENEFEDDDDDNDEDEDEDEDQFEDEEFEEDEFEEDEEEESEDDTADVNSYHRKKRITKYDKQFIDEYDKMMEQYRAAVTKKTNINNLKHASVLAENIQNVVVINNNHHDNQYHDDQYHDDDDDNDNDDNYNVNNVPFRLLSKKGATSTKLKVGVIKIPKQIIVSMKSNQKKENEREDKIKSVTLQHLKNYQENDDDDDENDLYDNNDDYVDDNDEYENYEDYEMIDDKNNIISSVSTSKSKYKTKQHSISAKRKYKQNIKQIQHQQIEDEREKQKIQRDEKRKKQSKFAAVTQDF